MSSTLRSSPLIPQYNVHGSWRLQIKADGLWSYVYLTRAGTATLQTVMRTIDLKHIVSLLEPSKDADKKVGTSISSNHQYIRV